MPQSERNLGIQWPSEQALDRVPARPGVRVPELRRVRIIGLVAPQRRPLRFCCTLDLAQTYTHAQKPFGGCTFWQHEKNRYSVYSTSKYTSLPCDKVLSSALGSLVAISKNDVA
jgi:hypothetical protein